MTEADNWRFFQEVIKTVSQDAKHKFYTQFMTYYRNAQQQSPEQRDNVKELYKVYIGSFAPHALDEEIRLWTPKARRKERSLENGVRDRLNQVADWLSHSKLPVTESKPVQDSRRDIVQTTRAFGALAEKQNKELEKQNKEIEKLRRCLKREVEDGNSKDEIIAELVQRLKRKRETDRDEENEAKDETIAKLRQGLKRLAEDGEVKDEIIAEPAQSLKRKREADQISAQDGNQ